MKFKRSRRRWAVTFLFIAVFLGIALYPLPSQNAIHYYDRVSGAMKTEKVPGESWLVWLYHNPVGEATLSTFARRKIVSTVYGNRMDRASSVKLIDPFIKDFGVDMSISQKKKFKTFNEFFYRKLKPEARPIAGDSSIAVSPADGKVLAYADIHNADFFVKGARFDVATFLDDPKLAEKYRDGSLLIFRLAPPDYHRYHFPVGGRVGRNHTITGDYFSVNPLALRKKLEIFWLNKREYSVITNPVFGDVVMVEVGATMVGSMITTFKGNTVKKGEEKGFFKFGGSTVVLIFEKDKIRIDPDFLKNTAKGFETTVKMGERIGVSF
ncbi:phosphatidylserine decarboxylase [Kaistella palustris]|uniref:phosphatidylserine decarboxylase n=1 Tax=Kaistella palustris TaxID=493376 RepID=UPI0003FDD56C|nr:phosphatidylserine decarboxylase [Kaistella palustris]